MGSKLLRFINASQRVVSWDRPRSSSHPDLLRFSVNIQGISFASPSREWYFPFPDLVEEGIRKYGAKPPSLMDRLSRRPSFVGKATLFGEERLEVSFWCDPPLLLSFDIREDEEVALWRELHIMMMSGGFDVVQEEAPNTLEEM